MNISVIICTHNPGSDYFSRTLAALKAQSYPVEKWELLVVDNASNPPLARALDLSWHPSHRIVVENELGILHARVRGLMETNTDIVLFVDDDNVLDPDYIEQCLEISSQYPFLGVWGGKIELECEAPLPKWMENRLWLFAEVRIHTDRWSNILSTASPTLPPTAGMCVRRMVADRFIEVVQSDPRRKLIGRRGTERLTNGEDTDLALTACETGLGMGQFTKLKMKHLISAGRLNEAYFYRLYEGTCFSQFILDAFYGQHPVTPNEPVVRRVLQRIRRLLFWTKHTRRMHDLKERARNKALREIASWNQSPWQDHENGNGSVTDARDLGRHQ